MAYIPTITKGKECQKCHTDYRYIDSGKCVSCSRASSQNFTNMELVNKRRRLQKEQEEKQINNNFYFED